MNQRSLSWAILRVKQSMLGAVPSDSATRRLASCIVHVNPRLLVRPPQQQMGIVSQQDVTLCNPARGIQYCAGPPADMWSYDLRQSGSRIILCRITDTSHRQPRPQPTNGRVLSVLGGWIGAAAYEAHDHVNHANLVRWENLRVRIAAVIPTYNEAENLPNLVSALLTLPLDLRLLVVDDNSPDGTGSVADELARNHPRLRVLHRPGKLGLRSAYLSGFQLVLEQGAEAVLQMDADMSHDPGVIANMAAKLEACDVVLGSRYIPGGSVDQQWPRWRRGLSAFGNAYARTILGLPTADATTGFRLWRRDTLTTMPLERIQSSGYVFLVEMIYLAYCLDYCIGEVPIYFAERQSGKSKMSFRIQAGGRGANMAGLVALS